MGQRKDYAKMAREQRATVRFPFNLFRHLMAHVPRTSESALVPHDPVGRRSGLEAEMAVYDFHNEPRRRR